ncbi:hypothetical protein ACTWQL_05350 [Pseudalkalibacillus sp. R45]
MVPGTNQEALQEKAFRSVPGTNQEALQEKAFKIVPGTEIIGRGILPNK